VGVARKYPSTVNLKPAGSTDFGVCSELRAERDTRGVGCHEQHGSSAGRTSVCECRHPAGSDCGSGFASSQVVCGARTGTSSTCACSPGPLTVPVGAGRRVLGFRLHVTEPPDTDALAVIDPFWSWPATAAPATLSPWYTCCSEVTAGEFGS
jgi:hypothetical protein